MSREPYDYNYNLYNKIKKQNPHCKTLSFSWLTIRKIILRNQVRFDLTENEFWKYEKIPLFADRNVETRFEIYIPPEEKCIFNSKKKQIFFIKTN